MCKRANKQKRAREQISENSNGAKQQTGIEEKVFFQTIL